jgi:hypothetical protein
MVDVRGLQEAIRYGQQPENYPSISARDPEIGVSKPDTEYAYTGEP